MSTGNKSSKNASQEKFRADCALKKATSGFVQKARRPLLVLVHNLVTNKLEIDGDSMSTSLANSNAIFCQLADEILSRSVISGEISCSTSHDDVDPIVVPPSVSCPLPLLPFPMFNQYKKLKEINTLRKAFSSMWRSLGFGTKQAKYRDPESKPVWWDADKFVPWENFKGNCRPENFTGNWAFLQYDILKTAYLYYLSTPEETFCC